MKKATAAPPPPRPLSEASNSLTGDSDSASVESGLEGRMRLAVVLPTGSAIQMEVERRTAMMDLLVQLTKAHNLNPGSYALDVKSSSSETAPYKPNTPIGTLGVTAIHVVPRARDPNSIHRDVKSGTKPFEKTFRLRVHLPRNQLHVLRVSPRTPLAEVFAAICSEKGLNPSRYELRHPVHEEVQLDHARCLADYDLSEVSLVSPLKEASSMKHLDMAGTTSYALSTSSATTPQENGKKKLGILSFFKKNKHSSGSESNLDISKMKLETTPAYSDVVMTTPPMMTSAVSTGDLSISSSSSSSNKLAKKRKPPAPPPPTAPPSSAPAVLRNHDRQTSLPATTSTGLGNELADGVTFAASHSRHSSDSSGYHESSILSDSPEISGADLECSLHFKGRKAASTTNIHLVDSTSSLSVSSNGTKKRKAPPPPPPMRSSTLPPTSKPQQNPSTISVSETNEQLSNGSLGSSTISLHDSESSSRSSSGTENRVASPATAAPVPRPRHAAALPQPREVEVIHDSPAVTLTLPNGLEEDEEHREIVKDIENDDPLKCLSTDPESMQRTEHLVLDESSLKMAAVETATSDMGNYMSSTSTLSRHSSRSSSSSSIYVSESKIILESPKNKGKDTEVDVDYSRTTDNEKNLKNSRKCSAVQQILPIESSGVLVDSSELSTSNEVLTMTQDSPRVVKAEKKEAAAISDHQTEPKPEEAAVLADAINEFHNETNSVKLNLTDLWSQVVTLPADGDVDDRPADDDDSDDDIDKLDTEESNIFDMPNNVQSSEQQDHNDGDDDDDLSANNLDDIYVDANTNQQSTTVNGAVLDKNLTCDHVYNNNKSNNYRTTSSKEGADESSPPEPASDAVLGEQPHSDCDDPRRLVESDLVVTWEYRIPDVPVEFQNDPKEEEVVQEVRQEQPVHKPSSASVAAEPAPGNAAVSTESLSTIYTSPAATAKVDDNLVEQKPTVEIRSRVNYSRKPVVQFSISTYRNRASEETSYQDKLGRVDSFNGPSSSSYSAHNRSQSEVTLTNAHSVLPEEVSSSTPDLSPPDEFRNNPKVQDILDPERVDDPGEESTTMTSLKKAQTESQLDELKDGQELPAVKDVQQLQEEYTKLQQQFIQWQRQLLTNQNLLQKQNVLQESTTNPLRPLQEFQDQFASLPPMTMIQPHPPLPPPAETKQKHPEVEHHTTTSSSTDSVLLARNQNGKPTTNTTHMAAHGPRHWRPVSVDLSPWTLRPKFNSNNDNNVDYGSKSLNLNETNDKLRGRDNDVAFRGSSGGKLRGRDSDVPFRGSSRGELLKDRDSVVEEQRKGYQSTMDRVTSFNEHMNVTNRQVVKINRQVSHAASFPRDPVVRGFATLPTTNVVEKTTSNVSTTSTQEVASKRCVKTVTYFGDPVNNVNRRSAGHNNLVQDEIKEQQRHMAHGEFKSIQKVRNQPKESTHPSSSAAASALPNSLPDQAQVNGNSKFFTVVSVGHAAARQQAASFAPPPPPPPLAPAKFAPKTTTVNMNNNNNNKINNNKRPPTNTAGNSTNTMDDRDQLMSAIRDFGGRFGLKKVSAIETRWQSRHGNVN